MLSPVRLEIRDGRAVVSGREVVDSTCEERARPTPMRAEDDLCRMQYMNLKEQNERLKWQVAEYETSSSRRNKRQRLSEGIGERGPSRCCGGGLMTIRKRRWSREEV